MNLNLCKNHKQEWKQSHYDSHNCDHCRLEEKLQKAEERLDWILSRCLVNDRHGISLMCSNAKINSEDKSQSIKNVDQYLLAQKEACDVCPQCGSGDIRLCNISVRPYCAECNFWGPINFETMEDAIEVWNKLGNKN